MKGVAFLREKKNYVGIQYENSNVNSSFFVLFFLIKVTASKTRSFHTGERTYIFKRY